MAARSARKQAKSKSASKWGTRKVTLSFARLTKRATVTLLERKSGYAVLAKVANKSADLVCRAIKAKLETLNSWVKTLAVDKGKEFAEQQSSDHTLRIQTYFADPYFSWLCGGNEIFNKLMRNIPKKQRIETVTDEKLTTIENRLNKRPRKRL